MQQSLVVNVRSGVPYDVYIGRGRDPRTGKMSKWGNPYSHQINTIARFKVNTRTEAIQAYVDYLLRNTDLMSSLPELRGKVLGCWCKPLDCHGDILSKLANAEKLMEVSRDQLQQGYQTLTTNLKDWSYDEPVRHEFAVLCKTGHGTYVVESPE